MPVHGPKVQMGSGQKLKLNAVAKAEILVVNYTDGYGKEDTRLVIKYSDKSFFFFPRGTDEKMEPVADWLAKQLDPYRVSSDTANIAPVQLKNQPLNPLEEE